VVRFVKRAQQLGFTLNDIEDLLHLAGGGPDSCDEARATITDCLTALGIDVML
jgi:MerR family transcriptional regulator, mercuric resistance operon regulatory protein